MERERLVKVEEKYPEINRLLKRDFGSRNPLTLQIDALLAALDRKDDQIADLMQENARLIAAVDAMEQKVQEAISDARLTVAAARLISQKKAP